MTFRLVTTPREYADLDLRADGRDLDDDQRAVLAAPSSWTVAIGGPGTGKTTTVLARALAALERGEHAIVLARGRLAAAALHAELAARLGQRAPLRTTHTVSSLAYALLALAAERGIGGPVRPAPRMVTGADADAALAEIIADVARDAASEEPSARTQRIVSALEEAALPLEALTVNQFRQELRDSIMRAQEFQVGPEDVATLATSHGIPAWHVVAEFYAIYEQVQSLAAMAEDQSERLDVSALVAAAANLLVHAGEEWQADGVLPSVVVVDDAQELTRAGHALLRAMHARGVRVVLVGNPDQAVETFRGAQPEALAASGDVLALRTGYVHGARHARSLAAVAETLPTAGSIAQRRARPRPGEDAPPAVRVLPSAAQEEHHVVASVREALVREGRAARDVAVIVRSSAEATRFARVLRQAEIPVRTSQTEVLLTEEPAVRPLLAAARLALDVDAILETLIRPGLRGSASDAAALDSPDNAQRIVDLHEEVAALLVSPLIGADPVRVRQLRRVVAVADTTESGSSTPSPVRSALRFAEACLLPPAAAVLPDPVRPMAERLAAMVTAGANVARTGAPAEAVLWALWESAGLAEPWAEAAMAGGRAGQQADHHLDAVMALFELAKNHAEREFGASADVFLEALTEQTIPTDTLAKRGSLLDAVSVLTVGQAAGTHWPFVIVPALYDGSWPDTRLRDTTLAWQRLADTLAGVALEEHDPGAAYSAARSAVLAGETRMLLAALACASEQVLLTSVDDGEILPSAYLSLVGEIQPIHARRMLSTRGLTARLRSALESERLTEAERAAVADRLAALAATGTPGAHPDEWPGLWEVTSEVAPVAAGETTRLAPSQLEPLLTCPLRQFLQSHGAHRDEREAADVGTLVHELAEEFAATPLTGESLLEAMVERFEELWADLPLRRRDGWYAEATRKRILGMVERLARYLEGKGAPVAAEHRFEFEEHGLEMSGSIDRIEAEGEACVVVDFKTSKAAVSGEDAKRHPQLAVYQRALEHEGRTVSGGRLVYPGSTTAKIAERSQDPLGAGGPDIDAYLRRARDYLGRTELKAYVGSACDFCPVRRSCPAQREGENLV
ncbi:MAG: PD-(D/E)XK nuclease family protein [Bowdeniella nasicola]|nr:PD-(D/E)XK nuclease family protein [Bowdeniella nasicola]